MTKFEKNPAEKFSIRLQPHSLLSQPKELVVALALSSKRLRLDSVGTQNRPTPWNQSVGFNSIKQADKFEPNALWRKLPVDSSPSTNSQMFGLWTSGQGVTHCHPVDMDIEKNDEPLQNFHSPLNSVTEFPILSA